LARSQQSDYVVIKAAFHLHTSYSLSEGNLTPTQLVDAYADAGYNCIALTDHSSELNASSFSAEMAEAKAEGAIRGVIVIAGEEIVSQFPMQNGSVVWKHVLGLFMTQYIAEVNSTYKNNEVQYYFDAIHGQGGLGIVAHSWQLNDQIVCGSSASPWWQYINSSFIDGWEIFNWGPGMTEDEIDSVINRGKVYVCSHDYGGNGPVPTWEYNILYCPNNTEAGVEDALINQRNVVYHYGNIYGSQQALSLYEQQHPIADLTVQHSYLSDLEITVGVGSPSTPSWSTLASNRTGGKGPGYLDLTVDLTGAEFYLPPSTNNTWFLKIYDGATRDQGNITSFTITYLNQTYMSQDVPVGIYDFQTCYVYIPPAPIVPVAHISISHSWLSDLNITIGVGSPSAPSWSQLLWNRTSGKGPGYLNLTVDLSSAVAFLPPSNSSIWFLRVNDNATGDQGNITSFTITYLNQTYMSQDVPVAIYDFQTCFASIPDPPAPLVPTATISIKHSYIGDLNVTIAVGSPSAPLWSRLLWNRTGGRGSGYLNMTVDLSDAVAYLPPANTSLWFLKVYDGAASDQGNITSFTITYLGQVYASQDVPMPVLDYQTSYAYIPPAPPAPPAPTANILIVHSWIGDLNVTIGVGSPTAPSWSQLLWNRAGGKGPGYLNLTVDLSAAVAYLPPTNTSLWFLKVYDGAASDQGNITSFTITYLNQTYVSQDVPVPVLDLKTCYAYIPLAPAVSPVPVANISIQHTYLSDLRVTIGVGPPSNPLWSQLLWNRIGGKGPGYLNLTVDLSGAVAFLPPSNSNTWFLSVYDGAALDQGNITSFVITYLGQTYVSQNVLVPILDNQMSYAYIKG